jgi:DNA-binding CsgD family transcriptional regulator
MLKFELTNDELDYIKSKIHFTPMQERIIGYRMDELSIVQMAMKENCSEPKISKEIAKIKKKIYKVIV